MIAMTSNQWFPNAIFITKVLLETFFLTKSKEKVRLIALCCFLIGDKWLDIVEECSCVDPHCYRLSSFEGFPEQYTDSQGNTAMRTKVKKSIKPFINEKPREIVYSTIATCYVHAM